MHIRLSEACARWARRQMGKESSGHESRWGIVPVTNREPQMTQIYTDYLRGGGCDPYGVGWCLGVDGLPGVFDPGL